MNIKKMTTFCFIFLLTFIANAQQESRYYTISYEGGGVIIENITDILDNYFTYFNEVFHFDKAGPGFKYRVKVFGSRESYQSYVQTKTDSSTTPPQDGVFLRYDKREFSELAVIGASFINNPRVIRQLFVQYIFGFAEELPAWILAGFPLYFEASEWQKGKGVVSAINESHPWIEPAKIIAKDKSQFLNATQILAAQSGAYPADQFMPQSYLLAYFFTKSRFVESTRMFFEGIAMLRERKLREKWEKEFETTDIFLEYQKNWISADTLNKSYITFIEELRSVRDELANGVAAYSKDQTDEAINFFNKALELDEKNSTAMYYIGLSMHKQKRYKEADSWYKKALDAHQPNTAYIYWALGTSAVADWRTSDALEYLNKAKEADPTTFASRVDNLIKQLETSE
ncbi:MAG: tetratricopeptide repeat protein [Treponemataceae bacterium]